MNLKMPWNKGNNTVLFYFGVSQFQYDAHFGSDNYCGQLACGTVDV